MLRLAVAGVLLSALGLAQASYTYYGPQCAARGPIGLTVEGLPRLGGDLTTIYTGPHSYMAWSNRSGSGESGSQPILLIGVSDRAFGALPLPFMLPWSPYGQCQLLASAEIMLPMATDPRYNNMYLDRFTLRIPNDARLFGVSFYQQWLTFTRGCVYPSPGCNYDLSSSNGGKATVGL
jgi:hypothetical protein